MERVYRDFDIITNPVHTSNQQRPPINDVGFPYVNPTYNFCIKEACHAMTKFKLIQGIKTFRLPLLTFA